MSFDFTRDHFELFDLPRNFRINLPALEAAFRTLQSHYHPDRAAALDDTEKRKSLQAATHINEAFQTLKFPLGRGRYLLHLAGIETHEETNTAMPPEFLMQQMEWREMIVEAKSAKDVGALQALGRDLEAESTALVTMLAGLIDDKQDYDRAAQSVRKLRFMEKLEQEVGDAVEHLLD